MESYPRISKECKLIQVLEIFQSLPLTAPAIVSGTATLLIAAGLIFSQRGRMQELNARFAEVESD